MQQPALIKAYSADHLWSLEELDDLIPALVAAKKEHDARVALAGEPEHVGGMSADA